MSVPTWYVGVLAFVGLQRLGEMFLSKRNQRQMLESGGSFGNEPLFAVMVALHVGLLVLPALEVAFFERAFVPLWGVPALVLLLLAQLLRVWVLVSLRRSWNVQIVTSPTMKVIDTGPYAYIRHPNYLAVIIEIAVIPMVHSAWLSALFLSALNAWVLSTRIPREEAALFAVQGYPERMGQKKRFLPGMF